MKKEQSDLVKELFEGGYPVISGYATLERIPIGRIENGIIYPETISPLKTIEEHWGSKEKAMTKFTSYLKQIKRPYRENGSVVEGDTITSWKDYKRKFNIFD